MWLLIYILVLVYALIYSLFKSPLHIFALVSFVYSAYYFSWSYRNGSRSWPRLRQLSIWDWLRKKWFSHRWHSAYWDKFRDRGHCYLFIVCPNVYNVHVMAAFGTHGKENKRISSLSPSVMLPKYIFYLPVVTDIIQWLGGIVHTTSGLLDALDSNKSVVWAPNGMLDALEQSSAEGTAFNAAEIPVDVFKWIELNGGDSRFSVVPVLAVGEVNIYWNAFKHSRTGGGGWTIGNHIKKIQRWFYDRIGRPFPLFVFGWGCLFIPKPVELHTYIGEPISVTYNILGESGNIIEKRAKRAEDLMNEFHVAANRLNVPDVDGDLRLVKVVVE